jgi:hypothetical protein
MPRYFFHMTGTHSHRDDEGVELDSRRRARTQAFHSLGELLRDTTPGEHDQFDLELEVTNDRAATIFRLRVTATDFDSGEAGRTTDYDR